MSACPACGHKLKLTDISQNCPKCKVNMRFVNFEEKFYREAKVAELANAKTSVFIARVKASFIGSKLTIAKLVVMILPLVSMLLPFLTVKLDFSVYSETVSLSALDIYNKLPNGGYDYLFSMASSPISGSVFAGVRNLIFLYTGTAVFAVLCLLLSLLGFFAINKMPKVTAIVSAVGIAGTVATSVYALSVTRSAANVDGIVTVHLSPVIAVTGVMFIAVFVVNLILYKKGIPVEYAEGMLERVEIAKKIRAKELDIESLPQPIVETEETRKIDEEIIRAREDLIKRRAAKKEEEES